MEPLIQSGENIELLVGYYNCNDLQRGDLVAYDFANSGDLFIKKLFALPGDKLQIKNSQLLINGDIIKNSIENIYIFTKSEQKLLKLYIIEGKLKKGTYLIFGDNIRNSTDSRKFGGIGKQDIIGKFKLLY